MIIVDSSNLDFELLLETFINSIGIASKSFRYFDKRPASVFKKHIVTILIFEDENSIVPIGYGHLEIENDIVWLGICVLPAYWGKKIGSIILIELIKRARANQIQTIHLTVDEDNIYAIKLYERFGFKKLERIKNFYKYSLNLI